MVTIDREYLLDVLRRLIAINSINPSLSPGAPGEAQIALSIAKLCRDLGLDVQIADAAPGRPNVVATLKGEGRGPSLLLNGHVDTVSVDGMERPFAPDEREGRIYGRGAYDMKGSLAAMLAAVAALRAQRRLRGDLTLAFVADEEYASLGTEALVRTARADAAIVTEATELQIGVAHKGFAWVQFETAGVAAHGSRYDEGRDAIAAMGDVLVELRRLETNRLPQHRHPLLGRASVHASLIEGGEGLSTYPSRSVLRVERRTLPGETPADIEAEMRDVLQRAIGGNAAPEGKVGLFFFRPAYEIEPHAPVVLALSAAGQRVLGVAVRLMGLSPWMDSAILGAAGIPTVIFGPSGAGAHAVEEYVDTESVVRCAQVLAETAVQFCGAR
jgi:acetylornithine deacetylase